MKAQKKMGAAFAMPIMRYRQAPVKEHKQKTRPTGRVSVSIYPLQSKLAVFMMDDICVNANLLVL